MRQNITVFSHRPVGRAESLTRPSWPALFPYPGLKNRGNCTIESTTLLGRLFFRTNWGAGAAWKLRGFAAERAAWRRPVRGSCRFWRWSWPAVCLCLEKSQK